MLDLNLEANTVYLSRPLDEYKHQNSSTVSEQQEKQETEIVRPPEQVEAAPESGNFTFLHENILLSDLGKYYFIRQLVLFLICLIIYVKWIVFILYIL